MVVPQPHPHQPGEPDPLAEAITWWAPGAPTATITAAAGTHTDVLRGMIPTRGNHVYLAYAGDELVYVGQTEMPRIRLRQHCLTKSWWSRVDRLLIVAVADELHGRGLELALHLALHPTESTVTGPEVHRLDQLVQQAGWAS